MYRASLSLAGGAIGWNIIVRCDAESQPGEYNLLTINSGDEATLEIGRLIEELTSCPGWRSAAPGRNEKPPWLACEEEYSDEEYEYDDDSDESDEGETVLDSDGCPIDPSWLKRAPRGFQN